MSRPGPLARKQTQGAKQPAQAARRPLDVDEDLFAGPAARQRSESDALRSLLAETDRKLDELDGIKASIRRIVEPISKTLRDYDMTQKHLRRLEAVQSEIAANAEVQRGKAADLEKRLAQQTGLCHALEEKRQQLEERLTFADQHKVALRKVLADANSLLLARAAQVREQERCNQELAAERDALKARVSDIEAILHARESELKGVDQAHTLYIERYAALARAYTGKECALVQAERSIAQLSADLHREKWEREQLEEALRTARQESAVAMRNLAILQRNQASPYRPPRPAANAA
jgi:chromosome segregation ATPase